jgi:antitoxin (DNA-binding transcriptional repressor) of toxin-antitoxin stability system
MKKVTLKKFAAGLGEYVRNSGKHPVLILHDGEPVAMLVGVGPKQKRSPAKLRDILKHAWKDYEEHGGIPHEQFWKELVRQKQ